MCTTEALFGTIEHIGHNTSVAAICTGQNHGEHVRNMFDGAHSKAVSARFVSLLLRYT